MSKPNHPETTSESNQDDRWYVYIIESSDGRLYTGITTDVKKRWHAHCHTRQGAKFFRGRSPKTLLYIESGFNRSSASKREAELKKLTRTQKLKIIDTQSSTDWHTELTLGHS